MSNKLKSETETEQIKQEIRTILRDLSNLAVTDKLSVTLVREMFENLLEEGSVDYEHTQKEVDT